MKGFHLRSSRFYLAGAVIAAVLSALLAFAYLRGVSARAAQSGKLVNLVVAARDLAGGEVLDSSSLESVPFPDRYLLPGTYTDPSQVTGRSLSRPVGRGEPILESALFSFAEEETWAALDPGFRAFPLPSGAITFPLSRIPADGRVDVIFVEGDSARLGMENVKVVGISANADTSAPVGGNALGASSWSSGCVLLEVTPEEACRLASALEEGRVEIMLRPREEF